MHTRLVFAALSLACTGVAVAQTSRTALTGGTYAITNVTVVPMTAETLIRDATVLVRDGRIAAVGPSRSVSVPRGARRVDGRNRFLIPGLADMHTHLHADEDIPDSVAPHELGVMIANGVTSIRLMIGTPEQLTLRQQIIAGQVLGPQLWIASPQLAGRAYSNGVTVTTPDRARAAVRQAHAAGYDFIKLTLFITPDIYAAIVEEAARLRIPVVGHVDLRVGVARALAAGQHIEHLDAYFEAVLVDSLAGRTSVSGGGAFALRNWPTLDHVDWSKVDQIAGATARSGTYTSPTLTIFNNAFAEGQSDAEIRARPDWALMPPAHRDGYLRANARYWADSNATVRTEARRLRYIEVRNRLVRAIADSGGRIMTGSDTPEWFHGYGFALHRELASLVAAGLTPWQALAAATRTPAAFLGASAEWGTIETGKRADLVLLGANPLADIRNTTRIEAVSIGGRWIERAELDRMIQTAGRLLTGG